MHIYINSRYTLIVTYTLFAAFTVKDIKKVGQSWNGEYFRKTALPHRVMPFLRKSENRQGRFSDITIWQDASNRLKLNNCWEMRIYHVVVAQGQAYGQEILLIWTLRKFWRHHEGPRRRFYLMRPKRNEILDSFWWKRLLTFSKRWKMITQCLESC